ncbi:MAG: hypothetical protein RIS83_1620 [Pseudomonadota bacterium]
MEPVDLALVLAVDASSSVDRAEFDLMIGGYAHAFREADIAAGLLAGPLGASAIAMVMWSGQGAQEVAVPWTKLASSADVAQLADAIETLPRLVPPGATALGEGMAAALALFATGPKEARRMVLDVSGDGAHNQGRPPGPMRDIGVQAGITINALAVLNEEPDLMAHYAAEVIGGPGAFVMHCPDYEGFAAAIREKLRREIAGVFIA